MKALAGAGDALHESEDDSRESCAAHDAAVDAHAARRADALALLAETFLAHGAAPLAAKAAEALIAFAGPEVKALGRSRTVQDVHETLLWCAFAWNHALDAVKNSPCAYRSLI